MKYIKYVTKYDVENSGEGRVYALSTKNIDDYIFSILIENGWNVTVISPTITENNKGFYRSKTKEISKGIKLKLFTTFGSNNNIGKIINKIGSMIQLFFFLIFKVKRNEPIIIRHSLIFTIPVYFAKRIKKFKLILNFGEEYNKVKKGNKFYQWAEPKVIECSDKFIFANDLMGELYNVDKHNYLVLYGQYLNNQKICKVKKDNKIHIVYAGIISITEESAFKAINLANYLNDNYVIHILGKIDDNTSEEHFYSTIKSINNSTECKVIYEGVKSGYDYIKTMSQYDIGLNLRKNNENYIDFAFPSKVLSYLNLGLRVVSSKIKCVEQSEIGDLLFYYDNDDYSTIASTIKNINLGLPYNPYKKLESLDKKFRANIDPFILS